MRKAVVLIGLAGMLAAGCGTSVDGTGQADASGTTPASPNSGAPTPSITINFPTLPATTTPGTVTTPPSSSPAPTTTTPKPPAGKTQTWHGLKFVVPTGWSANEPYEDMLCLQPAGANCTVRVFDIGQVQSQGGPINPLDTDSDYGWYTGGDVPACPPFVDDPAAISTASKRVSVGTVKMTDRTAAYATWKVTCDDRAYDFQPRLWWLPKSKIGFVQVDGYQYNATVDKIMSSVGKA